MIGSQGNSRSRLVACRTKPTEAKPKNSLFGSVMERMDPEGTRNAQKVDLDEYEASLKPKMQVRNPPPVFAAIKGIISFFLPDS